MLVKFTWKTAGRWFKSITLDNLELAQSGRAAVKKTTLHLLLQDLCHGILIGGYPVVVCKTAD
jgi:hypothetical protein